MPLLVVLVLVLLSCAAPVTSQESQITSPSNEKAVNGSTICRHPECSCRQRVAECDCVAKVLHLSPGQFAGDDIVDLHVRGKSPTCLRVTVKSNTFGGSSVKRVKMENLRKIMLNENSFRTGRSRPELTVDFRNVEELVMSSHSFSGSISSVTFINTTSKSVPDKAFVGTAGTSTTITFENSTLGKISGHAFSQSRLKRLAFRDCVIGPLESDAISPSRLSVLQLEDCSVDSLQPAAISVSLRTLNVTRCRFGQVAAGALAVRWSGKAWLHNNTFRNVSGGAFSSLSPTAGSARLEFHDSRLLHLDPGALRFSGNLSSDQLTVRRLRTEQRCRCDLAGWLRLMSNTTNTTNWLVRRLEAAVHCEADGIDTTFPGFWGRECRHEPAPPPPPPPPVSWRRYTVIIAVAAALVTVLCAVSCFAVWQQSRRRRLRQRQRDHAAAADALRHRPHKLNNANLYSDGASTRDSGWSEPPPPESPRRPLVVAVPDVKTYTETEVHVVLETLESMEPPLLPRTPSTGTLQRLREGSRRPTTGATPDPDQPQSPGCRKSCPL